MRAKILTGLLATGLVLIVAVHPAAQAPAERKLQLSFDRSGLVTLIAQNVTVREILLEWARVGGTQMVNADKLAGGPVTVQFEAQPESVVLESLLRPTAGWILYPRLIGSTGASVWQSVSILPTSHPTSLYTPTSTSPQIAPVVQPMPDDEIPPVNPAQNAPGQTQPTQGRPTMPGVYVPLPATPSGPPTTTPGATTTTGRGRGGG
ncbi:MAG: hypothetical protein ACHQO8_00170 [Vicinamibacterales bacterium]